MKSQACPLCNTETVRSYFQDDRRDYLRCQMCHLIFVPSGQFLSEREEKVRYDLHQNRPEDQRYRQFLGRIFNPLQERLAPGSYGLDFGSGPGPTLSVMFEEAGHSVTIYDYYYARKPSVLEKQYDFITATEVLEHLHMPGKELDRLWNCLKPGGSLGVMTKLALEPERFSQWHYKNDPTHVCFFSRSTFEWLAAQWLAELTFVDKDAAIFLKK
ncbi:MAG: class I SAM-dependent methyltransferase [Nitrospirae bacterium]|nr:class I SAM-dependent methyltransferase [Nitrospirota bacterium]